MAEETKKNSEVELDLSDAKETEIQLEDKTESKPKQPNLNVGEVDLGYTSHAKEKKDEKLEIEEVEEKPQAKETKPQEQPKVETEVKKEEKKTDVDNLLNLSEDVRKRIDKLTFKMREAERREKAATDYAKGLQKKYAEYENRYNTADEQYLKEFDARVDAQREQVKIKLKAAIEANDSSKIMEANDELTQLAVQKEKAKLQMADRAARVKQLEDERKAQAEQAASKKDAPIPQPSEKARNWAQNNTWFGEDKIMTQAAFTIHEELVGSGVEVESDQYYNEINNRMRNYFPQRFTTEKVDERKPVQTVASAGRKQQGRRTVRLTKSQVAIAKKLGVPLEEYAKFVKEV